MAKIQIERTGGFAGLRCKGELDLDTLSQEDLKIIDMLFKRGDLENPGRICDGYLYKISRQEETIILSQQYAPDIISQGIEYEMI